MSSIFDKLARMANSATYDVSAPNDRPQTTLQPNKPTTRLSTNTKEDRSFDPEKYIFRTKLPGGGCAPILKVLMSDECNYNCTYCAFRRDRDVPRDAISPDELVKGFRELVRRGTVGGIFISSAFCSNPSRSMDKIIAAGELIRRKGFRGYLHLKVMPGADDESIRRAISLGSRVSINLEAPTEYHLGKIAPEKNFDTQILRTLNRIQELSAETPSIPAGFTTQFVVGASDETDADILKTTYNLYETRGMRRAYFSNLSPVIGTPLAYHPPPPQRRQGRLYQADWLLRFYGFEYDELPFLSNGNLPLNENPKIAWAKLHPELFPIEINDADIELLLRVPGIGHKTAKVILKERRTRKIYEKSVLRKIGVKGSTLDFITLNGRMFANGNDNATQQLLPFPTDDHSP